MGTIGTIYVLACTCDPPAHRLFEQISLLGELLWWVTHYCEKHAEALTSALEVDLIQCNEEGIWRKKYVCLANRFRVFKALRARDSIFCEY